MILSFIIIPLIFLFIFEIIFYSTYKISKNKFFENFNEASKRKAYSYSSFENNLKQIRSEKKKLAIFGGSIAFGYGVPNDFANIIKRLNSENLEVHNYSVNGGVFSNYQSQLIEKLMPYYDYLIIYSGDNELWSYLCLKAIRNNELVLPDGMIINSKCRKTHEKSLKKIEQSINYKKHPIIHSINYFKENSRFYLFINRIFYKLINIIPQKVFKEKKIKKFEYLVNEEFLHDSERLEILNNFQISLENIKNKLSKNQKLIIIKPISNDLIPPTFDQLSKGISKEKFIEINESISLNYINLLNNQKLIIKNTDNDINHLNFFNGIDCLNKKEEYKKCFEFLEKSRNSDKFPLRILKEIEDEIVKSKNDRIAVIDLDYYLFLENNINYFRSFFIDAQHLSSKSHALIAEKVLKEIYPEKETLTYKKIDNCENYLFRWDNNNYIFINEKSFFKEILNVRLEWQESFMAKSEHRFNLDYFYKDTKSKLALCIN